MRKLLFIFLLSPLFLTAQVEISGTLGGVIYGSETGAGVGPMHMVSVMKLDTVCFGLSAGYAAWHFTQRYPQTRGFARIEAGYELSKRAIFMLGVDVFTSRSQGYVQVCLGPRVIYKFFTSKTLNGVFTLNGGLGGISYLGTSIGLTYKIAD